MEERILDAIHNLQDSINNEEIELLERAANNNSDNSETDSNPEEVVIEEIHPSVMDSNTTARFRGAEWFEAVQNKRILVAGLGGIGSHAVFNLSRLGVELITVYDNDTVDISNMSGQLYGMSYVGEYKARAIREIAVSFSSFGRINAYTSRVTDTTVIEEITISGFDNMASREALYTAWTAQVMFKSNPENFLYIDARLSAEELQIYCFTGSAEDKVCRDKYEKTLFSDSEAEEPICSYKQTTFCASMIGSLITNLVVNFVAKQNGYYRDLPFFTYYNATTMLFKTEH